MKVYYKKLHPDAQPPSKGTPNSVGWDLCAVESTTLSGRLPVVIKTGIAVACPAGVWLKIFDRSSLALRGFTVTAGVVDNDYRGEIGVVMFSCGMNQLFKGSKIAQMIVMPHIDCHIPITDEKSYLEAVQSNWEWVEATGEQWAKLSQTSRGDKGFGSTGA